jgi:NAD(P)H-hydrate epimerase
MPLTISREQARELDRRAAEEYGLPSIVLMENAGRGVADTLCSLAVGGPVAICCGGGNNGGDGFVVARHLDLRGYDVRVFTFSDPGRLRGDALANYQVIEKGLVPIHAASGVDLPQQLHEARWIVDALLGTGARGEPRSEMAEAIDTINSIGAPILAVDVPSGLDCDTGAASEHTIRAAHTCTFVATKPGFLAPGAGTYTGTVHVLDIGAPRRLVESILKPRDD